MRMQPLLLALALAALSARASASDFTQIWNGTSGVITVRDNGQIICQTSPYGFCSWTMADGFHRVEVTGANGVTLHLEGTVPNDDFTGAFEDCDFTGEECEEEEW